MDPDPASPLTGLPSLGLLLAAAFEASAAAVAAEVAAFVVLLGLSAYFSGSEVALFSLGAHERRQLADDGTAAAQRVLRLLERPRRLLITILLLNNLANVAAAILAAVMTGQAAAAAGWDPTLTFVLEVVALTFLLLVLSEISPKLLATKRPVHFSKLASGPLLFLSRLLLPATVLLTRLTELLQRVFSGAQDPISGADIKTLADVGQEHGSIEREERELIHSIVDFGDTTVREVMTSRLDIHALPNSATLEEALELIRTTGHSRLPLFQDHLDNVLGIVYAKDLIPMLAPAGDGAPAPARPDWAALSRPARFVPPSRALDDMLADFQAAGTHMAIVVDEYGGTAGLVTLEDVLEEIVGDIFDEYDEHEPAEWEPVGPRQWRVDGRVDLDDLFPALGVDLDPGEFDFETLGGLVLHVTGEIPTPGDVVQYGPLAMRVEEVEAHRIKRVLVEVEEPASAEEPGTEEG